jgi:hypothetical protein
VRDAEHAHVRVPDELLHRGPVALEDRAQRGVVARPVRVLPATGGADRHGPSLGNHLRDARAQHLHAVQAPKADLFLSVLGNLDPVVNELGRLKFVLRTR